MDNQLSILTKGLKKYISNNLITFNLYRYEQQQPQQIIYKLRTQIGQENDFDFFFRFFSNINGEIYLNYIDNCTVSIQESFVKAFQFYLLVESVNYYEYNFDRNFLYSHFLKHLPTTSVDFICFVPYNNTQYIYANSEKTNWKLLLLKPHQIIDKCLYCFISSSINL